MKKIICLLLAVLLLCGCQANVPGETTATPETTAAPTEMTSPEETTSPTISLPESIFGTPEGDEIPFENPGKVRMQYSPTGVSGFVRYITSPDQLPDVEALKGYDEAFFREHALVIVSETVNTGSMQLEIGGIYRNGDTATVTLKRTMEGDVGTADMATWLLWAEVSRELDCDWVLENASRGPQVEKY